MSIPTKAETLEGPSRLRNLYRFWWLRRHLEEVAQKLRERSLPEDARRLHQGTG